MLGQPAHVVAPHHQHAPDDDLVLEQPQQGVEERRTFPGRGAGRPQLLQLVADEQHRCRRGVFSGERRQAVDGSRPRHDDERLPLLAPREGAGTQRRHQAGAHHRRLPRAAGPGHDQQPVVHQRGDQRADEPVAPAEDRGVGGLVAGEPLVGTARDGRRRRWRGSRTARRRVEVERGVLVQDRLLQLAQPGAGLDPELVDQHTARAAERLEGVGLPPAAVERQRLQRPPRLVQRPLADQPAQLRHGLGMAAEGELGLPVRLQAVVADTLEAFPLVLEVGGVRPVGVRTPAPEAQRPAQQVVGGLDLAGRRAAPGPGPRGRRTRSRPGGRGPVRARTRRAVVRRAGPASRWAGPGSRAVRSRTTCACSDLRPVRGGAPSHSTSSSRSTLTEAGEAAARAASSRRSLAPGTATTVSSSPRTSSGPRTASCIRSE